MINGLGTHAGVEFITILLHRLKVLVIREQLTGLQRGHVRLNDNKGLKVEDALDIPQGHIQQQANTRWQRL